MWRCWHIGPRAGLVCRDLSRSWLESGQSGLHVTDAVWWSCCHGGISFGCRGLLGMEYLSLQILCAASRLALTSGRCRYAFLVALSLSRWCGVLCQRIRVAAMRFDAARSARGVKGLMSSWSSWLSFVRPLLGLGRLLPSCIACGLSGEVLLCPLTGGTAPSISELGSLAASALDMRVAFRRS